MSDNIGRVFGAIGALAALWIIVYWWWEPHPRISMDPSAPAAGDAAVVEPRATPAPAPLPPGDTVIAPPATGSKLAVIPPRFRDYTIRKGDTMESVAERELGSRRLADALRSANALMDPEHLKTGRTLRIPLDPTNIQGKPVPAEPAGAPAAPQADAPEYTVKAGDTLSGIAKARYGSTKYKDLIYQANRDRLGSEDDLREGQKLRLPPKPQ